MKYLQRLLALVIVSAAIFSCQKEYSVENNGNTSTTTAQWEFKEGGVQFKGPIDTVSVDTISGYKFLTINGRSDDGTAQFTLQAFGADLKVGTYKTPFSLFAYIKGTTPVYQTDQAAADSFTIVITRVDATGVAGTFSGRALSGTTGKAIVDGKFTAAIKTGTTTPPTSTDSGQVVLWSKAGCGGGTSTSPISVTINGKTGQITSFSATEPSSCTPTGSFGLTLPVGSYPWVAKCGTDSVTGTVTVTKGGCTKQIVDFTAAALTGDYYPLTKNSNWGYLYEGGSASDTVYTFNPGSTATLLASVHTLQVSDYGPGYSRDSIYCRKSGNNYYQYVPPTNVSDTTNGVIVNVKIPEYDFRFLVDNLPAGGTFSDQIAGTATSNGATIALTFKFNATILATGATVTVGGKSYTNVIKVKIVTTESSGFRNPEATEYWYGLNVGAIKYLDYYTDATFTTPDDVWNLTHNKVY